MKAKVVLLASLLSLHAFAPETQQPKPHSRGALRALRMEGNRLFHSGRHHEAIQLYDRGRRESLRAGDARSAGRFSMNIGSCRFAMLQYRPAMRAFLDARRLALASGDLEAVGATSCNLSSLYLQLGEVEAGLRAAQEGLAAVGRYGHTKYLADLLAQAATLHARRGDFDTALVYFRRAIAESDGIPEQQHLRASAWDLLGYELLERGQTGAAEHAFLEAFRIRTLSRLPDIQYSHYALGLLELARSNAELANRFLSRALNSSVRAPGTLPLWRIHLQRGRALLQLGRPVHALAAFQAALDSVARWRIELLPADSLLTNAGVEVHQVYSAYIQAANTLYLRTGSPGLLRQAFRAAEEDRAAGLRALVNTPRDWQEQLPEEYWETLARLRAAEISLRLAPTPSAQEQVSRLHYRLLEMEAADPLEPSGGQSRLLPSGLTDLPERVRMALHPEEAFLGFHLGERESWLWALTREGMELHQLSPRSRIASLTQRFEQSVRLGLPEVRTLGGQLHRELFGKLGKQVVAKPRWLLALDGDLFQLPFAALVVEETHGVPVYLVERHSAQLIPGAYAVLARKPGGWEGPFVGVADAIHNTADPRWIVPPLAARTRAPTGIEMPRLAGSGREARRCAAAWGDDSGNALLLEGPRASREELERALRARPSIVHFATHFLAAERSRQAGAWRSMTMDPAALIQRQPSLSAGSGQAMIALSLRPGGGADLLSPTEILRWRRPVDLVVLSGCASGRAEVLPGSGLMGMARAWLASGAGSVAATLWPTPDDSGELFVSFYAHLRKLTRDGAAGPAAVALRQAQIDALRSRAWRAAPGYWAACFVFGKE